MDLTGRPSTLFGNKRIHQPRSDDKATLSMLLYTEVSDDECCILYYSLGCDLISCLMPLLGHNSRDGDTLK